MKPLKAIVALVALPFTMPLFAHHAFSAEFDRSTPITVAGAVSKVEWTNPHIWIYVDAKDADGKVTTWAFQGGPPAYLSRSGWSKSDLKIGDMVTVQGFRAKDGSNHAAGGAVTLPDGRKLFALQIESPPPANPPANNDKNDKK